MTVRPATLAALLFAVLALAVAACGDDETTTGSSGAEPNATATATQDADAGQAGEEGEQGDQGEEGEEGEEGEQGEEGEEGESEEEREKEEQEAREAGSKACSEVGDIDGEPKNQPPDDVAVLQGAHLYESEGPFGKTERFFASVDGEPADLPKIRDDAKTQLEGVGFKTLSTDEEENTEAEAHMQGDEHTVDIQVIALCEGKLRIRYTVS
jgi:hypothetical protein